MTYTLITKSTTKTFATAREARSAARALGGKLIRRASATPDSLAYYELPSGEQVCVRRDA